MVNRSKTEYDETAKAVAAAYEIYEQYKQKADALLEEYNRVTSTTSSINIEYETDKKLDLDYEKIINEVVNEAAAYEKCPYEIEVNVTLTDNEAIHQINKEFREVDAPTDVLSFPMINYEAPSDFESLEDEFENNTEDYFNPDTGELMLGDIVVSVEKVAEQAEKYGHSEVRELAFLVAHSMMHLFGYDHMTEEESKVMEAKQREVLDNIGITR